MQPQSKDPHTVSLGQRGGQKRMQQLNAQERSTLARYAARSRTQEITNLVKQALKDGGKLLLNT